MSCGLRGATVSSLGDDMDVEAELGKDKLIVGPLLVMVKGSGDLCVVFCNYNFIDKFNIYDPM